MSSFGTDFVIVNDIQQEIPNVQFVDGPAVHHATIKRGVHEFVVFRQRSTNKIYIEQVEANRATFVLKAIQDDTLWQELAMFCRDAGLLNVDGETKHAN